MTRPLALALAAMLTLVAASASAQSPAPVDIGFAPRAVGTAFDHAGNVYVAKLSAPLHIDVHSADGTLIAQWGVDGPDPWSVTGPYFLATDSHDHLFITERAVHNWSPSPVQEFTTDGTFIGPVGFLALNDHGPGAIQGVGGAAVGPDDLVYVTDGVLRRTHVFSNDRVYLREWPSFGGAIKATYR